MIDEALAKGVAELGIPVSAEMQQKLLDYLRLMEKWNQVYNLTAVRRIEDMVGTHLLDSLAIAAFVGSARNILDVGSGPGLPGVPLAVAKPEVKVTMLDSNQKKTTFVQQAISMLGLTNANVVCERVEQWQAPEKFDFVVSRAFASIADFLKNAGNLCADGGTIAAMKGVYPEEELQQIPAGFFVLQKVVPLKVPGIIGERHVVLFSKSAA